MERNSKSISIIKNHSYSPENIIKNDKLSRFFKINVDKNELTKLYKRPMSKELLYNKQKNELFIKNKKLFSKKRNINGILPSNISFFRLNNIITPPFKISDVSERNKKGNNISQLKKKDLILHYTQIKPIKITKSKIGQYQKDSKSIRKVNVNRNNIHLFSRKNNRKEIEMENYKNYTFNKNSFFYNEKTNTFDKEKQSISCDKYTLSYKDKTNLCYKDKSSTILLDKKNEFNTFELNISNNLPISKISLENLNDLNKPFFIIKDLSKVFHNKTLRLAMKKPIVKIKLNQ